MNDPNSDTAIDQADDEQGQAQEPKSVFQRFQEARTSRPGTTMVAFHLTAAEFDELRADPEAANLIEISSDGADLDGVRLAVEGLQLPDPEPATPALTGIVDATENPPIGVSPSDATA